MRAKKSKQIEKINLTPIMDTIFIFIFFLLMSSQFIDINQIGTDAPIVSEINPEKDPKKPLNLTLVVSENQVVVKTGLDEKVEGNYTFEQFEELNEKLLELKQNNPTEKTAILKPDSKVKYQDIVKVIDIAKEVQKDNVLVTSISSSGVETKSNKLFDQIVFETQE